MTEAENKIQRSVAQKDKPLICFFNTARDYTDEETPCSISNQEAKLVLADDTLPYWDVWKSRSLRALLLFF